MPETRDAPGGEPPNTPRWLWWTLAVSVAVNMVIIGFIVGAAWRWHAFDGSRRLDRFAEQLPPAKREPMLSAMRETRAALRPLRRARRAARRALADVIRAERFDRAAYAAASETYLDAVTALRRAELAALPRFAEQLDTRERRALIRMLRRHRHGRYRGRRRDD